MPWLRMKGAVPPLSHKSQHVRGQFYLHFCIMNCYGLSPLNSVPLILKMLMVLHLCFTFEITASTQIILASQQWATIFFHSCCMFPLFPLDVYFFNMHLVLFSDLHLHITNSTYPSDFLAKTICALLLNSVCATCPHLFHSFGLCNRHPVVFL